MNIVGIYYWTKPDQSDIRKATREEAERYLERKAELEAER